MAKGYKANNKIFGNSLPLDLSSELYGNLPTIYPQNPLSWIYFSVRYAMLQFSTPPNKFDKRINVSFDGISFLVKNEAEMKFLWTHGFFGKGTLSRSDPTWKERLERGDAFLTVDDVTKIRRDERKTYKSLRSKIQSLETEARDAELTSEKKEELNELKSKLELAKKSNAVLKASEKFCSENESRVNLEKRQVEYLQLQYVEVFFLLFALNRINVDMPLGDLFSVCCNASSISPSTSFILKYVVYHHYRSLGWCVRSGIKFGCDYLLYKNGPPFGHAQFTILVMSDPKVDWNEIAAIARVVNAVKKILILVYIEVPSEDTFFNVYNSGDSKNEKLFLNLFKLYKVNEIIYRRWVPNRNRD